MKLLTILRKQRIVWLLIFLAAFIYMKNTSLLAERRLGKPLLLAHRGLARLVIYLPERSCISCED
ncbi:MAG: hypothetical protein PHX14_07325 [Syntrophomonadaceae bacterium]|nr:hypothetical protein [Syntrophomonadaceae bacterium]